MVNVREERTRVKGYTRENGTRVSGHPTHAVTGDRRFGVFWRKKEVVLPGGTKHHQRRDVSEKWHLNAYFTTNERAERARRKLMDEGKHVVILNVGARSTYPDLQEVERMLREHDLDLHRRR